VPSLLSIKSLVGVANAVVLKTNSISRNRDLTGFKNLSGLEVKFNLFFIINSPQNV
jgi:hypothetical protein